MYDIHSHILPAMDDGARNLAESIRIAEETVKKGIKGIVATPHFMEEGYRFALPELEEKIRQFQEVLKKREIDLEIYPGAEVFIYPGLIRDLEEGLVPTINKSSYLLLEFPMYGFPPYTGDLLYNLQVLGYKVIIAHPERYREVVEAPDFLYRFARGSIYAQVNSSSLLGVLGERVKRTAEILFLHNMVQLIGSDLHSTGRRGQTLREGVERLKELDRERAELLLRNNRRVIEDKELECLEPLPYRGKGGLLDKLRKRFLSDSVKFK